LQLSCIFIYFFSVSALNGSLYAYKHRQARLISFNQDNVLLKSHKNCHSERSTAEWRISLWLKQWDSSASPQNDSPHFQKSIRIQKW